MVLLLSEVPRSGPAVQLYREIASGPTEQTPSLQRQLRQGWDAAGGLLGVEDVGLGAWLAAERIAVATLNVQFLRSAGNRRTHAAFASRSDIDPSMREVVARLRQAVESTGTPDWPTVRREIDALLAALGS